MAAKEIARLRRLSPDLPGPRETIAAVVGGLIAGLCFAAAINRAGAIGALAPAIAILALILLRYPGVVLTVLVGATILIEPSDKGLLPTSNRLYEVIGHIVTPLDLLVFAALAGVLIRFAVEGKRPTGPAPLTAPLALLALATLSGIVTSHFAASHVPGGEIYHRAMNDVYIIALPILFVNLVRTREALRACLVAGAALAAIKGVSGLYAVVVGSGMSLESDTVSYLDPTGNLVMMVFLFGVAAAAIRRIQLPPWVVLSTPIVLAALFLSYRRSFWLAALFGIAIAVIIGSRYRLRTVLAMAGVAVILGVVAVGFVHRNEGQTENPLVERVQTLNPVGEDTKKGDQYRNDERASVIATIEEHPFTGVGLGQQWKAHGPLAESHPRDYVHFAILWFWLELGPLGVLAYLSLLAMMAWTGFRVFSQSPDPLIQCGAIAGVATVVGLFIVELTTTFTAVDPRYSLVVGAIAGWLAAAWRTLPSAERTRGFLVTLGS
jgi:O-antigen ligase